MIDLVPGTLLGGRFDLHGVVGRGGSATVWLATDRLRGERVALKVLHAHLGADAAMRRRVRREVVAAAALVGAPVLAPYDLHELDGHVALSMPFHHGQTLAERVASGGPLPPEDVRALGVRLSEALAAAHRAGVLHRDVTACNVLLDTPGDAVLTDFGLARLEQGGTRSTGLLGTAGYAAPEVYSGVRSDPRSDLYGLGAVLYLAATGKPAFASTDPIGALKAQLEESFPPVRTVRPDVPDDLAETIELLLRRDPDARPAGARDVADRLVARERAPARLVRRGRYLPPGHFTVLVRERDEDKRRRQRLRVEQGRAPSTAEVEIARWGKILAERVRDAIGIPASPEASSPEGVLTRIVAEEAGVPPEAVQTPPTVLHPRFLLVDHTDRDTAWRLAQGAVSAGFKAEVVSVIPPSAVVGILAQVWWLPIPIGWVLFPWLSALLGDVVLPFMIGLTIVLSVLGTNLRTHERVRGSAVAFKGDLSGALVAHRKVPEPQFQTSESAAKPVAATPVVSTRGQLLRKRADEALGGLSTAIAAADDLPDPARYDLETTVKQLREQAGGLETEVDRLEAALGAGGAGEGEVAQIRARLDRLRTLRDAGDKVDARELSRLEASITQHEADGLAAEQVEARLSACCAELVEIASTASRVRRELVAAPRERMSADEAVRRLRDEATLADRARREAAARVRLSRVTR